MGASKERVEGSCDEVALLHFPHWGYIYTYQTSHRTNRKNFVLATERSGVGTPFVPFRVSEKDKLKLTKAKSCLTFL